MGTKVDLGPPYGIIDLDQQMEEFDKWDSEQSLYHFLKQGWKYIDPAPWQDGWPIQAVAEHLEAVASGEIRNLIVNIPPRCSKSSLVSVAFPAWVWAQPEKYWGPTCGPGVQFLAASYAQKLSIEHSIKCRRLIKSPWYQKHWGKSFALTSDQDAKMRFENDKGGYRFITSVDSGVTGSGGQIIILDDPNDASDESSEAAIESAKNFWDGTISTRLNDPNTGSFIIVQQRISEDDITGHILSSDQGEWTHLMLPMFYEPERSFHTDIGWKDPRTEPGELLWPERFSEPTAKALERRLGPFRASGQLQQSPEPQGGGIIKRDWWQPWEDGGYPLMDFILASLDTAYTEKTVNDPSALTIWGVFTTDPLATATRIIGQDGRPQYFERTYTEQAPKVMLMKAWTERLELHDLVTKVAETCKHFRVDKLLIEAKASGISVAQELRRLYGNEGFAVQLNDPKSQDKISRLYSVQHLFSEKMVWAPDRKWADEVISQCAQFPKAKHDDLVDTVSQAMRHLRDLGMLVRGQERLDEIEQSKQYTGRPPAALYF
jgi:predicted phage terminase large subunit-like protein